MKRINRRYPYIHPGKKSKRQAKIAVSVDQSGSVSSEMMIAFFSELNKLAEIATFTVIPFDDRVFEEHIYEWKKGQKEKGPEFSVVAPILMLPPIMSMDAILMAILF